MKIEIDTSKTNIAGLDLATTSGLTARVALTKQYVTTTYKASPPKKKAFLDPNKEKEPALDARKEAVIALRFENFLTCWLIDNNIGYVGIEAPLPSNGTREKTIVDLNSNWAGKSLRKEKVAGASLSAIYRIYGLSMVAVGVCARLNIPVIFVHQGSWRAHFLGNGRPKNAKDEAVKMCARMGIPVSSVDAAESVGITDWLYHHLTPQDAGDLFQPKRETLAQAQIREEAEKVFKPRVLMESK